MILDGERPAGNVGGDTLARLILQAADDEDVAALVLRIDSPGGSGFASEIIREALLAFRDSGKPLVASMGSVAASGGYWIAAPADEIWASPTTITGSIGVLSAFPSFSRGLAELGVSNDGVATTRTAGGLDPTRPLSPAMTKVLELANHDAYRRFIGVVAEGRNMAPERVAEVAEGRAWSGAQAAQNGLVDHLGDLDGAIAAAARLATLEDYRTRWIEEPRSWAGALLERLSLVAAIAGRDAARARARYRRRGRTARAAARGLARPARAVRDLHGVRGVLSVALALALALPAGCASVSYLGQAAWGQARVLAAREPLERVIDDPHTEPALRARLVLVRDLRAFAVTDLAMRDASGFEDYAALRRDFAVWNVVATPEFSLRPLSWCFPVAGCVAYRGYFGRDGRAAPGRGPGAAGPRYPCLRRGRLFHAGLVRRPRARHLGAPARERAGRADLPRARAPARLRPRRHRLLRELRARGGARGRAALVRAQRARRGDGRLAARTVGHGAIQRAARHRAHAAGGALRAAARGSGDARAQGGSCSPGCAPTTNA